MIRWVVGKEREAYVGRFPTEAIDVISQPAVILREKVSREIELEVGADIPRFGFNKSKSQAEISRRIFSEETWTVCDKEGGAKFVGQPMAVDSAWCHVRECVDKDGNREYHVFPVRSWLQFSANTSAQMNALDLEESEKLMKEQKAKAKTDFSQYLKDRSRRAEELGIGIGIGETEVGGSVAKKIRKTREDKSDGEWEGEEEFSDDDEKDIAAGDEETNKAEEEVRGTIEVEEEDVADLKAVDHDTFFKDTFGDEISKIIKQELQKSNVNEDDLDAELGQFERGADDEEEDEQEIRKEGLKLTFAPKEQPVLRKVTKEDQIRARVKGMFWRNEYKLKLKDVLAQFPGLSRNSEEYQFLTRALKDLSDVVDNVLQLKEQYRK